MKVLIIEDQKDDIQGIKDHCEEKGYSCEHKNFEEGLLYIEEYDPDILVLDLKNNISNEFDGCDILDKAWNQRFRPTCVFSGQISDTMALQEKYNSPLVVFIDKGDEDPVNNFIDKIKPYADCIKEVRNETNIAMRKSFDFFHLAMKDNITDHKVISALCSNRMKTYFDNEMEQQNLPVWSQYIYPVLNEKFSTGDIIEKINPVSDKIEDRFFVILSQSCDIAHKKIKDILVAKCSSIEEFIKKGYKKGEYKSKDEVKSLLNTGFLNGLFPLPEIDSVIPDISVNLKKLELIKRKGIEKEYKKIASLSSPYKERLIWAYMQTACRPGVPGLDVEKWCDRLLPSEDNEDAMSAKSAAENKEEDGNTKGEVKISCTA